MRTAAEGAPQRPRLLSALRRPPRLRHGQVPRRRRERRRQRRGLRRRGARARVQTLQQGTNLEK